MVRKHKSDWRAVQLPKELVDEVEKIIDTSKIKKRGITSISQFISRLIDEELEHQRFTHENTYEDKVRIRDDKIGKLGDIVTIFLKSDTKKGFCDYCESEDCIHVKYMWELPDVVDILKKRDFSSPYKENLP
jgi:hypothetical protein